MYPGVHAAITPDKPATIMAGSGEMVTYRQLEERSIQLARAWRRAGLRPGDHVALLSENHPRFHEVYWAAARSGLYLTPISRHLSAAEAAYIVNDCGAEALVVSFAMREVAARLAVDTPDCRVRMMFDGTIDDHLSYEEMLDVESSDPLSDQPRGEVMMYSSGTTGRPRGIKRPLRGTSIDDEMQVGRMRLFVDVFGMDAETRYLSPAPLYHAAPLGYTAATPGGRRHCGDHGALRRRRRPRPHRATRDHPQPVGAHHVRPDAEAH